MPYRDEKSTEVKVKLAMSSFCVKIFKHCNGFSYLIQSGFTNDSSIALSLQTQISGQFKFSKIWGGWECESGGGGMGGDLSHDIQ